MYHAVVKRKKIKPRNPYVAGAKLRSGAGPMGDGGKPRVGSRGARQDDPIQDGLEEWESEAARVESSRQSDAVEDNGED